MAEISIRTHTRRGKGGKVIQVRGYTRRVGRKGVHSPKKEVSKLPGEEYEEVASKKKEAPKLTPEEIVQRREVMEGFRRAEEERKSLGMSREKYSRYVLQKEKKEKGERKGSSSSTSSTVKKPLSSKGSLAILERIEDKVANFVEKYGKKKYKRIL